MGRTQQYHQKDHEQAIIDWISEGKTLRDYCRQEGSPSFYVVYNWLNADDNFAQRFARAREIGHDVIAEEALAIADDASNDWMEQLDSDDQPVGWKLNGDHVQRSKLRIETRLKLLAKWNPKRYGDKLELGSDPEKPIITEIRRRIIKPDDNS